MNIKNIIENRYSVKKFDSNFKLGEEQLDTVKQLLQMSPSSVNIQPWHFTIATSEEGIEKVAKSTENFGFNDQKIRDAAALIVISVVDVSEEHLNAVTEQEDVDGRFTQTEMKASTDSGRKYFYNINNEAGIAANWLQNQAYLNAGHLVLGLSAIGLDSVIMEGFDPQVLSEQLALGNNKPVLIIGVGRSADDDYNRKLPKSRLAQERIIDLI